MVHVLIVLQAHGLLPVLKFVSYVLPENGLPQQVLMPILNQSVSTVLLGSGLVLLLVLLLLYLMEMVKNTLPIMVMIMQLLILLLLMRVQ